MKNKSRLTGGKRTSRKRTGGKRKGFIFTIITLLLFALIFYLGLLAQRDFSSEATRAQLGAKQVAFSWDDVNENLNEIVELNYSRVSTNASFQDVIPETRNTSAALQEFENFTSSNLIAGGLRVYFNPPLSQLAPWVELTPFNVTYAWDSPTGVFRKTGVKTLCNPTAGSCDRVSFFSLSIVLNESLVWDPTNASNQAHYSWSPAPENCAAGTPHCVFFKLNVTDSLGKTYACPSTGPGVTCGYYSFLWKDGVEPAINVSINASGASNCFLNLSFDSGNLFSARAWNSLGQQCARMRVSTLLQFNETGFDARFNVSLKLVEETTNSTLESALTPGED